MKLFNYTKSLVVNAKLVLLTQGLDCDFTRLRELSPELSKSYKINQIRVSDRHFIDPKSNQRNWIPDELFLEDDQHKSVVKVYYLKTSRIILTLKNRNLILFDKKAKKEIPIKVSLVKLGNYARDCFNHTPLTEFIQIVGQDKVSVIPFDGCEHWSTGHQCKFCGANPSRLKSLGIKPNVLEIFEKFNGDYQMWWTYHQKDYYKAFIFAIETLLAKDKLDPHFHFSIISGNLLNLDFLWEKCLELSLFISKKINFSKIDSYFQIMPPKNLSYLKKAKEIGFKHLCFNLEVYNHSNFKNVCPGKEKYYGYNEMIKALSYGVKIFGKGNVRNNFVLGAAPTKIILKGVKELANKGIASDYSVFFPRPGSVWCNKKPPTVKEIINFSQELIKVYQKNNFLPYCCKLSSRSSIENEVYNGWL